MAKSHADEDYAFGLYPDGSGVMRNKLGIRDAETLAETEYRFTSQRTLNAPTFPPTKAGYQALHRHLFEQVYEWAGELRTVDFTKEGSRFASARFLDPMLHTVFANLAQQDFLRGRTGERFAEGAATHINELNLAHAYRKETAARCGFTCSNWPPKPVTASIRPGSASTNGTKPASVASKETSNRWQG